MGLDSRGIAMKTFVKMLRDESGASAAEYALILAIVGAGIATAAIVLGNAITGAMGDAATEIGSPTAPAD
jgi:pilus assembly protein Flp/PilA